MSFYAFIFLHLYKILKAIIRGNDFKKTYKNTNLFWMQKRNS
jgi:hypothetical protein